MTRLALIAALLATPAIADDTRTWGGLYAPASYVQMHEPTAPHAVATVTFYNTKVHGADETFDLVFGGIEVEVSFDWQADDTQAERITVFAPPGYAAVPPSITVSEGQTDVIHIIEWIGG